MGIVVPTTNNQGVTNESIPKINTNDLALPIPYCMGAKISISDYTGMIKGRTAIRVFNKFKELKSKPYWGNKFWSRGYCVDTVGLDSEMIRKYVKHQEQKERRAEQQRLFDI